MTSNMDALTVEELTKFIKVLLDSKGDTRLISDMFDQLSKKIAAPAKAPARTSPPVTRKSVLPDRFYGQSTWTENSDGSYSLTLPNRAYKNYDDNFAICPPKTVVLDRQDAEQAKAFSLNGWKQSVDKNGKLENIYAMRLNREKNEREVLNLMAMIKENMGIPRRGRSEVIFLDGDSLNLRHNNIRPKFNHTPTPEPPKPETTEVAETVEPSPHSEPKLWAKFKAAMGGAQ